MANAPRAGMRNPFSYGAPGAIELKRDNVWLSWKDAFFDVPRQREPPVPGGLTKARHGPTRGRPVLCPEDCHHGAAHGLLTSIAQHLGGSEPIPNGYSDLALAPLRDLQVAEVNPAFA
jgi:hypothetical protein